VDGALSILNFTGDLVCRIPLPDPVVMNEYESRPPAIRLAADLRGDVDPYGLKPVVEIGDLDGDGRREIVVVRKTIDFAKQSFTLYDDGCREIWSRTSLPSGRFGEVSYNSVFHILWVLITRNASQGWSLWVSRRHVKYYPSVLQKYDAAGNLLTEIWNGGEINAVAEGLVGGRKSIVIGGVNNEFRLPFVAKYDASVRVGVGPAEHAKYRCTDCPAGAASPRAYVLLPDSELGRAVGGMRYVAEVRLDHQWISVGVYQHALDSVSPPIIASTSYDLDSDLVPVRAEFSDRYRVVWDQLYRQGVLDRPFDSRQNAGLLRVRVWNGSRFRLLDDPARRAQ
jgi:hypothetical protein